MADRRTYGRQQAVRGAQARRPSQGQRSLARNADAHTAARKARGASHAAPPQKGRPASSRRSANVGSGSRSARSRSEGKNYSGQMRRAANQAAVSRSGSGLVSRLLANRVLLAAVIVVAIVALGVVGDTFANWGKAYGNVSIGDVDVSGMTSQDIRSALDEKYGRTLAASQVTVYASEEARTREAAKHEQAESEATAEQISAEDAKSKVTSWSADGAMLGASLPYEDVIEKALAAGRAGGPFDRLAVAVAGRDVELSVVYDDAALDAFAGQIDESLGEARVDATVGIQEGSAHAVEGHDGNMVDRGWLAGQLSNAMLGKDGASYVIAQTVPAPSRTTMEQAEAASDAVNRALRTGASFSFDKAVWNADATELGSWTRVDVVEAEGGWELSPRIDADKATSALVKHVSASASEGSAGAVTVDFEVPEDGGDVQVRTSGAGEIPEVAPAVEQVSELLFGPAGVAWGTSPAAQPVSIEVGKSSVPETLGFEQAVDLGLITVIGEYTTEFANDEGTENRNHNIKLVSDILNDTVCESLGGTWSFNSHSGDTNLDPPFASAGSIVNGEYVDSIGGGICQVATTIFNAVYEAGLDVVERRNHSLYIASYPEGRDVGVSYPELDFVWQNQLTSDVLLRLSYTDNTVTARLYSVYTGYKVETAVGEWQEGDTYKTEFETDDTLEKGDYYLKTTGSDGSKISIVRKVTDKSGEIISETEFSSIYEPKNEVYLVGPGTDTSHLVHTAEPSGDADEDDWESYNDSDSGEWYDEGGDDGAGYDADASYEEA